MALKEPLQARVRNVVVVCVSETQFKTTLAKSN